MEESFNLLRYIKLKAENMSETKTEKDNRLLSIDNVSSSATRTIRTQQGFSQHELTLPEDDAVIYMLLLKRNGIWFADVTT